MLGRIFARSTTKAQARALFDHLNAQARDASLYGEGRTPDTPDGRFELVTLFAFVLFRRLSGRGAEADALAQGVFDILFKSFDQALRDLGVGDLSVGKRIRKLAESFYGRLAAYTDALDGGATGAFEDVIARNVLGRVRAEGGFEAVLAARALGWLAALEALPDARVMAGVDLPDAGKP
jgi:cytochrome b pre-mRNA-processing protein 3